MKVVCVNMKAQKFSQIALIPARSGSKRLPGKNVKELRGVPLIAYTISSALQSNLFDEVIVSTDSDEIAEIAIKWGASVPTLRPSEYASDLSADIEWVLHCVENMITTPKSLIDCIAILRPTSPLRTAETIVTAFELFQQQVLADSLRAMEVTNKHPGKMWKLSENNHATPFLEQGSHETPTHDRPTQSLETLWVQNASLEFVRFRSLQKSGKISGGKVLGFIMPGLEGFDINTELDWNFLEYLVKIRPEILISLA
jgi:CMP-N,N'-diacetyllegionaminic acid synthase